MNVLERVQTLCKKQGVSIAKMERDIGISKGASYKWKTSDPSMEVLKKLAAYFNVPSESITHGHIDEEAPLDVAAEIQKLINALTDDKSSYCYGEVMSEEGKLALLNSLKQDKEFLTALYKKENK